MARLQSVSGTIVHPQDQGWEFASTQPSINDPGSPAEVFDQSTLNWAPITLPNTVAGGRRQNGSFSYQNPFDDDLEHWFKKSIDLPKSNHRYLKFDGLATLAEIFWNDQKILTTNSMFRRYTIPLAPDQTRGELVIRFKSIKQELAIKKPRPRWRTKLVYHQQFRWIRTTFLGRMPWSPPVAPVGPYRPVYIVESHELEVLEASLIPQVHGADASLTFMIKLRPLSSAVPEKFMLQIGDSKPLVASLRKDHNDLICEGVATIQDVKLWWPHTHGTPFLYSVKGILQWKQGQKDSELDFGLTGFRSLTMTQDPHFVQVSVNHVPIFCRGACWTSADMINLAGTEQAIRPLLQLMRDAGFNMVRISGIMLYETDVFYTICDELGLLVWQDFMLSNMDYPFDEPVFAREISQEIFEFVDRTQMSPSIAVFCGGNDIEQQAAMFGVSREIWCHGFLVNQIPQVYQTLRPETPYWTSTPTGKGLPFLSNEGICHYFGIGAYLQPMSEARTANIRFATECLGIANIPQQTTIDEFLDPSQMHFHHHKWKERVGRDIGSFLDFEEMRETYTEPLLGIRPFELQKKDPEQRFAAGRATSAEIIVRCFKEWRRTASTCKGALLWFLKDLWPGAGFGMIDACDRPKSVYYYLKRAMAPISLITIDEGVNGLDIYIFNDTEVLLTAELQVVIYRNLKNIVSSHSTVVQLTPRGELVIRLEDFMGVFFDPTYTYRFGPLNHDLIHASLKVDGRILTEDYYFPGDFSFDFKTELGLLAHASKDQDSEIYTLTVSTQKWAYAVVIDAPGFRAEDNYFHLAPGQVKTIKLIPLAPVELLSANVKGLNDNYATKVIVV